MESTFKIRSSATSKLMGAKGLGLTGQSYLESWLKEALYGRRTEVKSKYLDKGNQSEEDGFTLAALQLDLGMVYKNDELFQNDYMIGTPDLIVGDTVYDIKCSWSLDTFPMFDKECPNKDYWWQLQSYMELTGKDKAVLVYCLIDASQEIIDQLTKYSTPSETLKIVKNMVYTKENYLNYTSDLTGFIEIPEEKRIKTFEIAKDPAAIELIKDRVNQSREFIKSLI